MAHPVVFRYLSYSTTFAEHDVHCLWQCQAFGRARTCLFLSVCEILGYPPNGWPHGHGLPTARAMAFFFYIWHVTCDIWHMTLRGRWTLCQNFRSLALMVWKLRWFEEYFHKVSLNQLMNEWISEKGVCKTAPATPGLLKTSRDRKRLPWENLIGCQMCQVVLTRSTEKELKKCVKSNKNYRESTKKVPRKYQESNEKVLKKYWKITEKVLKKVLKK